MASLVPTTLQGLFTSVPRACAAADAVLPRTGAGGSLGTPAWCVCRLPQRCLTCTPARGGDERRRLRCWCCCCRGIIRIFLLDCIGGERHKARVRGSAATHALLLALALHLPARHMYDLDVPRQFSLASIALPEGKKRFQSASAALARQRRCRLLQCHAGGPMRLRLRPRTNTGKQTAITKRCLYPNGNAATEENFAVGFEFRLRGGIRSRFPRAACEWLSEASVHWRHSHQ
jgi:hypothetical protein